MLNKINILFNKYIEYETTLISAQEVIYSFRKTKDSPYPNYTDQEAIDALNKIKEVKNALSSG